EERAPDFLGVGENDRDELAMLVIDPRLLGGVFDVGVRPGGGNQVGQIDSQEEPQQQDEDPGSSADGGSRTHPATIDYVAALTTIPPTHMRGPPPDGLDECVSCLPRFRKTDRNHCAGTAPVA